MSDDAACRGCGRDPERDARTDRRDRGPDRSPTLEFDDRASGPDRHDRLGIGPPTDVPTHPLQGPTVAVCVREVTVDYCEETVDEGDAGARPAGTRTLAFAPGWEPPRAEAARGRSPDGTWLGGYLLIRELGRGGMGIVYAAVQPGLNRQVAIKRIRPGALAVAANLARFRGEAEVIATLDHPNIVPIYEIGEHAGEYYFCMKLFEGKDLRSRLADFRDRPREIARLVATIADAVQYAHRRGILHRDLKPSNILLDASGQPHLIDFGLALRVERCAEFSPEGIAGTPEFMAPEQASGIGSVTTLSDVYGLGGILYSLLTGSPPFQAETTWDLLKRVIEKDPVRPSERAEGVDHDLEVICLKGLAKDPAHRYATAKEMADDLGRWLDGEPIHARSHSRGERVVKWARRRPTIAALWAGLIATAALGLVGIVAALLLAMHHERQAVARGEESRRQAYLALIRMGARDYHDANIGRLLETLEATGPAEGRADLRGFEWYYLRSLCHRDRLTVEVSNKPLRALDIAPDGSRLVVVGDAGAGQVRDGSTGALIRPLAEAGQGYLDVASHPNGREVATVAPNGEVKLRDAATGRVIRDYAGLADGGERVVISPDGTRVAAGGGRGRLLVWDLASGRLIHDLKGHPPTSLVGSLAFSRDGRWLASSAGEKSIKIWDQAAGRLVKGLDGLEDLPRCLDFSDDGSKLAAGIGNHVVTFSTLDWNRALEFAASSPNNRIYGLDFNADGTMLATGGDDQVVRVWDAATGGAIRAFKGHVGIVMDVKFHPRLAQVVAVDAIGQLKSWGIGDDQDARELRGQDSDATDVHFSPTGGWFASAGEGGTILIWQAATGKVMRTLDGHQGRVRQISISPDGTRLASIGQDKTFRIFEVATGHLLHQVAGPDRLECVSHSPDGKFIAFAGHGRDIQLWDVAQGRVVRTLRGHSDFVLGLDFSPDGSRLASGGGDLRVLIWDVASGRMVGPEFEGAQDAVMISSVAFSPDGRMLAAAGREQRIRLWDSRTGQLVRAFHGHKEAVRDLAFSPDGRRLASSGGDCVRLWDVELGGELMAFEPYEVQGQAVAFSPDGRSLISADGDRMLRIRGFTPPP